MLFHASLLSNRDWFLFSDMCLGTCGAFFFVRGIVSFKGRTLVFFVFFAFSGQKVSKHGRVRRELDVRRRARNKMEVATWEERPVAGPGRVARTRRPG